MSNNNNFRYMRVDPVYGHQRLRPFSGFELFSDNTFVWTLNEQAATLGPQESYDEQSLWSFGTPVVGTVY